MADSKDVYLWSRNQAVSEGDLAYWEESYKNNCACAKAIEDAVYADYKDNILAEDCAKKVIAEFGYDRVNWVLANTIDLASDDGRYSPKNKQWARTLGIPRDEYKYRFRFAVKVHPGLVDTFTNQAIKQWKSLGLLDSSYCCDEGQTGLDYTDKVLVINPKTLVDEYKKPEYQLFLASGGNGCNPTALGTKVFGQFLYDGEKTYFRRGQFLGVLKEELLPDWAKTKLAELNGEDNPTETQTIGEQQ